MADGERAAPADVTDLMRAVVARQPFSVWAGVEIAHAGQGRCEAVLPMRPEFTQHHGTLQGGLIGYLADLACAAAAGSVVGDVMTSGYDIRFLSPGVGERFVARAEVVRAGRRLATVRCDVFAVKDGAEKLIAIATASIAPVGSLTSGG